MLNREHYNRLHPLNKMKAKTISKGSFRGGLDREIFFLPKSKRMLTTAKI